MSTVTIVDTYILKQHRYPGIVVHLVVFRTVAVVHQVCHSELRTLRRALQQQSLAAQLPPSQLHRPFLCRCPFQQLEQRLQKMVYCCPWAHSTEDCPCFSGGHSEECY